jgi:hypothetical protein
MKYSHLPDHRGPEGGIDAAGVDGRVAAPVAGLAGAGKLPSLPVNPPSALSRVGADGGGRVLTEREQITAVRIRRLRSTLAAVVAIGQRTGLQMLSAAYHRELASVDHARRVGRVTAIARETLRRDEIAEHARTLDEIAAPPAQATGRAG